MPRITVEDFDNIIRDELPWAHETGIKTRSIGDGEAVLALPTSRDMLRPGGTLSGPAMMMLSDACMYAVILGAIGPVKLAVTTNFNINFLRRPRLADVVAEGRMIKCGKRLAVMEVTLFTEGDHDPIAHATGTYSIPPDRD